MRVEIRACVEDDLARLRELSLRTYEETFGAQNKPETMARYLAEAFSEAQLLKELGRKGSTFWLALVEGREAGYLKLNIGEAQTEAYAPDSLEIERIYVDGSQKGRGIGKALLGHAAREALRLGKASLWLGVWEFNAPALAFYARMGFERVGSHNFRMGDEIQTDFVMKKVLATE